MTPSPSKISTSGAAAGSDPVGVGATETAALPCSTPSRAGGGPTLISWIIQTITAIETRRDTSGDLDYVAGSNSVPLSKQTIILIDDALSLANSQDQMRVDTDHMLAVMAESTISTSGLLRQHRHHP